MNNIHYILHFFPRYDTIIVKVGVFVIIKYNTEQLTRIIKNIFELTGISISVLDTEYNVLTRSLRNNDYCSILQIQEKERLYCHECDLKILEKCRYSKRLEKHICRAGLYDAAIPIIKSDAIVGYAIMGRVRSYNSPKLPTYLPKTDCESIEKLKMLYAELPFIEEERLTALYDLLAFILFENAIQIVYDPLVTEIVDFINENFRENLSVNYLSSKFHVSKNRLYKAFSDNFGNTVNAYIIEKRLKLARELLLDTDDSVYKISQSVGIDNYTYFCRLFKKHFGISPTEYRKNYK